MKHSARRAGRTPILAGLAIAAMIALSPRPAMATTGPDQYLPAPKYKVSSKVAQLYVGQYLMKSAATGARLKGGAMGIEVNGKGAMYGIGQFYGYDSAGNQSTWVGTLYNFQPIPRNVIKIDILAPTGAPVLGTLSLARSKQGDLSGQIGLNGHKYSISWHKLPAAR
jgi:hypothetical protein